MNIINKKLGRAPLINIEIIEALESKLLNVLSKNDAYLVRKYSNQQNREVVIKVINRNPIHKELINKVYFSWTKFFNSH
jgi:hypothetical protein